MGCGQIRFPHMNYKVLSNIDLFLLKKISAIHLINKVKNFPHSILLKNLEMASSTKKLGLHIPKQKMLCFVFVASCFHM